MTIYNGLSSGAKSQTGPGSIDAEQLALYWRKPNVAAARRMANRLNVRQVGNRYPWLSIWTSEGLKVPAVSHWDTLRQHLLTTDDVAILMRCDARSVRRYALNPPDTFPKPVFDEGRPWLWRAVQIHAYVSGRPVPNFSRAERKKNICMSDRKISPQQDLFNLFSST